jgi:hypothetical protein
MNRKAWPDDEWAEMKAAWVELSIAWGFSPKPTDLNDYKRWQSEFIMFAQGWSRARGLGTT